MKVILKEDVDNLGARGKVVNVKDGYARNYLLPRGFAMKHSAGAEKLLAQERRMYEVKQVKAKEEAEQLAERLSAIELTVAKRAGDQDVLYGSVTPTDIADLLEARGFIIDKRKILLREPVKKLGDFDVQLRLHREVVPAIKLHVVKEE